MKDISCFLILDFGSQYTWLIARCLRELGYYSRVEPYHFSLEKIKDMSPAGIILSGGPASVLEDSAPVCPIKELARQAPLLGICYGLQLICREWGGTLSSGQTRSYGKSNIHWGKDKISKAILKYLLEKKSAFSKDYAQQVWMSHGDFASQLPQGFTVLAHTETKVPATLFKEKEFTSLRTISSHDILALQFHPEVSHTKNGKNLLSYFAEKMCSSQPGSWTADSMLELATQQVRNQIQKNENVLCALSGGVDSTVAACLLTKILGAHRVFCIFVNTGLLRQNEFKEVLLAYKKLHLNVQGVSAEDMFMTALQGVTDPEQKRKIIGKIFIDVFSNSAQDVISSTSRDEKDTHKISVIKNLSNNKGTTDVSTIQNLWFMQGTLYPDVIESLSVKGPSAIIKSHHNVGGLPKNLPFRLIEPLRFLFKDEVRAMGKKLNIPNEFLQRHPFPGPGLAVRIEGEITAERLRKLRQADAIYIEELKRTNLYNQIWQAFCVLLSVKSVGVQGDDRTYDEVIVLRAVVSSDGMTADWFNFPADKLHYISDRITNEVKGVNRVLYDVTSKPPGTIEWM